MLLAIVSLSITSCIKDDVTEAGDIGAGSTFIKIPEARENPLFFSVFSNVKPVDLFSIRKDANSKSELNTATTVKLTRVDALIDEYNDENGTSFEYLPDSLYTTNISSSGGVFDMSLAPGEFAKDFTIQLNGAKWDISHTYALAVVLSDIGGKKASAGLDTVITFISVKNKYDGVYDVAGDMVDVANSALTTATPFEYQLRTAGPTKNVGWSPDYGDYYVPILNAGAGSVYGSFCPIFEFDPATDKVVAVTNYYGQPAGNSRSAELDPSGVNQYDPATKTLKVKFFMKQPSVITVAPNIRVTFDWELTYKGER